MDAFAARCLAYADRVAGMEAGSAAADAAMHVLLVSLGAVPASAPVAPYTRDPAALLATLPAGYQLGEVTTASRVHFWTCGVPADPLYAFHGQWGHTPALAAAGAVLRMWAWRLRTRG